MQPPRLLWDLARRASRRLRSGRWVTRRLFRADAVTRVHEDLWDATTLVLCKALSRYAREGSRVLDLGAGHIGVLSIYCARALAAEVTAADINEAFLANAARVAEASSAHSVTFVQSDWFSNVEGKFDIIVSNIPYVPTAIGESRADATSFREVWDGGPDGLAHARIILSGAGERLADGGRLLLGLNAQYVPRQATLRVIEEERGLELEDIVTSRWSPGEAYVMRKTKA